METDSRKLAELKAYKHVNGKPDVRRFVLEPKTDGLHRALLEKLIRAYKVDDSVQVYWKDPEGEFVSISSDDDVRVAINVANGALLKLYLVDAGGKHVSEEFGEAAQAEARASGTHGTGVHHSTVICDGCNSSIYGRRFKCTECADFDLCERCELVENRHPEHDMILIRRPSHGWGWGPRGRRGPRGPFHHRGPFRGCPPPFAFGARGCGPYGAAFGFGNAEKPPQPTPNQPNEPQGEKSGPQPHCGPGPFPGCPMFAFGLGPRDRSCGGPMDGAPWWGCGPFAAAAAAAAAFGFDEEQPSEQPGQEQDGQPRATGGSDPQANQSGMDTSADYTQEGANGATATPERHSGSTAQSSAYGNHPYEAQLKSLLEMGFDNEGGWLEQLLVAKRGNVGQVLDVLMGRSVHGKL